MKLRVLNGAEYGLKTGAEYTLSGDTFSIGRETDNDLVIPDASVSRKHCIFHKEGDSWIVEDNHSMNGFSINDKMIDGASEIFNGDVIKVHELLLQVIDETAANAPKPVVIPPKPQVKIQPDTPVNVLQAAPMAADESSGGVAGIIFKVVLLAAILGGCVWMLIQILAKQKANAPAKQEQTVEQPAAPAATPSDNGNSLLSEEDLKELKAEAPQPTAQPAAPPEKQTAETSSTRSSSRSFEPDAPALVLVESTPAGAEIFIDKNACGKTPTVLRDVEPGRHTLELVATGYEKYVTQIDVPDELPAQPYKLTLKQGIVSIVTEPRGAVVWEGRLFKGVTPLLIEGMSEGRHELVILGPGCEPHKETIEVTPARGEELNITLKSALGGLEVTTRPANCSVFLNGMLVGKTEAQDGTVFSKQLVINNIYSGNYVLKIEHPSGVYRNANITIPKRSNCVQKVTMWVPTHKLKLQDGTTIDGMLLEKDERGDIVMELPNRRPERYLKVQIDSLEEMDTEEIKEAVEKYSKANRISAGGSARTGANELMADALASMPDAMLQQYQNRQVMLTGKTTFLMKENEFYVIMFGPKIKCIFSQGTPATDYEAMSAAKADNENITIRGVCSGKINGIVTLKNCVLVAD